MRGSDHNHDAGLEADIDRLLRSAADRRTSLRWLLAGETSQFTFPMAALNEAYGVSGYETSVRYLAGISYATDNVFNDGTSLQMASVTGSPAAGYVATLSIGVHL
jgi:hypothetical protein